MFFDPDLPGVAIPDTLDHVIEVADMMSIFAAQRLRCVATLHREALADAAAHGRVLTDVVERGVRLELAAALRVTEHAASALIELADALVHRYPSALASLEGARITERHAEILATGLDAVDPELRAELLPRAVELAESQPVGTFRRALRRLVDTVQTVTLAERSAAAVARRRIVVEAADDGMSWLLAYLPSVEAQAIHQRATAIAKVIVAQDGEERTLDQVRADVLCDLLIDGETGAHPEVARGIRATVVVTVPALALLAREGGEGSPAGLDPAVVEGVGPIPIERARELCGGDAGWMRVLTHPETGMVLSVGREQYAPPASLRRLVKWRADRCMAPGCGVPAARCDTDHTLAWEHGGSTSLENLAPICRGHHMVKHHGGWRVEQVAGSGGSLRWTSPAGRSYVVAPERRVPAFRPPVDGSDPPF
ncbi:HNH endonuclease signature motif containing protein [Microbacterium sp. 2FI]|uniref:HNH endonuclease signature motif containing protein n=1 Tax=Microbacterium sp. 2FI TaxID=2502193 RepID=UPI002017C4A3|nr:HNH endonuclease signature motif containing protein [Microbacterium sp. 2FI]